MGVSRGWFFPSHSLSRSPRLNLIIRTRNCDALKTWHLANVFLAQETRFEMKDKQELGRELGYEYSMIYTPVPKAFEYIFNFIVYLRWVTMSYFYKWIVTYIKIRSQMEHSGCITHVFETMKRLWKNYRLF